VLEDILGKTTARWILQSRDRKQMGLDIRAGLGIHQCHCFGAFPHVPTFNPFHEGRHVDIAPGTAASLGMRSKNVCCADIAQSPDALRVELGRLRGPDSSAPAAGR
jgi:hypothetical protein